MSYSTPQDIQNFSGALLAGVTAQRKPLFVLDMDGNILIGHNLTRGTSLGEAADSARRDIPEGLDMQQLLQDGLVEQALFANKPMDARLPKGLVERLNHLQQSGADFNITILTSRSEADALQILRDSGVNNPERHTMISDSGAVLRCRGERKPVRELNTKEQAFLNGIPDLRSNLEAAIDEKITQLGMDTAKRPPLRFEPKGIACNIHFRELLSHYGASEDSALAHQISDVIGAKLHGHIAEHSPSKQGAPSFKLLHGPATLEVKLADIHKGHGLQAVVDAALEAGEKPSAIIFAGDDICTRDAKGAYHPGTDYYAFKAAADVEKQTGIPVRTIHTLHPADATLDGTSPDAARTPPKDYPQADITVSSPLVLGELVENILSRCAALDARVGKASHSAGASR